MYNNNLLSDLLTQYPTFKENSNDDQKLERNQDSQQKQNDAKRHVEEKHSISIACRFLFTFSDFFASIDIDYKENINNCVFYDVKVEYYLAWFNRDATSVAMIRVEIKIFGVFLSLFIYMFMWTIYIFNNYCIIPWEKLQICVSWSIQIQYNRKSNVTFHCTTKISKLLSISLWSDSGNSRFCVRKKCY